MIFMSFSYIHIQHFVVYDAYQLKHGNHRYLIKLELPLGL